MSISHHSENPGEREALNRFLSQLAGSTERGWPEGRISGEDDGATAYAIAADPRRQVILIRFPKPMDWIGLGINDAMALRNKLDEKINELTKPRVS
jgi:hypothetical protein